MRLVPLSPTRIVLAPHYEQIRQFGLDAQLTVEAWLLKLEAIYRQGARNAVRKLTDPSFLGNKEAYAAFVVGGEYTFNGVFGTDADLSLLAEWMIDGRRRRATNQYQNDLFLGARLAFNDVQGAEFIAGALLDLDTRTRTLNLEFNRRLTELRLRQGRGGPPAPGRQGGHHRPPDPPRQLHSAQPGPAGSPVDMSDRRTIFAALEYQSCRPGLKSECIAGYSGNALLSFMKKPFFPRALERKRRISNQTECRFFQYWGSRQAVRKGEATSWQRITNFEPANVFVRSWGDRGA